MLPHDPMASELELDLKSMRIDALEKPDAERVVNAEERADDRRG